MKIKIGPADRYTAKYLASKIQRQHLCLTCLKWVRVTMWYEKEKSPRCKSPFDWVHFFNFCASEIEKR